MKSLYLAVFGITLILQVVANVQSPSSLTHALSNSTIQNVTFKLLAVETRLSNVTVESAQLLINGLLSFSNWQNNTVSAGFQYTSHIHLLSENDLAHIDESSQPFYRGRATRENLLNEISTFLTEQLPFEEAALSVRIFYFAGNTRRIVTHGNSSYCLALDQLVYDWELNQVLPKNSSPTLVILDACYSGGFITELAAPGRSILTACSPFETVAASLCDENHNCWSLFTGIESAMYSNGTYFGPLGIVGGIKTAPDSNRDGWRSAREIFRFASQTVRWYASNQTDSHTGKTYTLNPWAYFGVVGGEIPLARHNSSTPFPHSGKAFPFPLFSPDPFRVESETLQYRMHRHSPNNLGFSKAEGPDTPNLAWSAFLSDPITGSASVADGMVFIGTAGGTLYAVEMTTGDIIWSFSTGSPISSSPAIEAGIVVFGTEEPGRIYALNEYTGKVRWIYEVSAGSPVLSSPTIKDGKVFIASSDGYLRVFTLFEGFLVWESYMNGNIGSSPAVSDGVVFVAGNDVCAFDEFTGALIWRFTTSWPVSPFML